MSGRSPQSLGRCKIGAVLCLVIDGTWRQELHEPGDGVQAVPSHPDVADLAPGLELQQRGQREVSDLTEAVTKLNIVNLDRDIRKSSLLFARNLNEVYVLHP